MAKPLVRPGLPPVTTWERMLVRWLTKLPGWLLVLLSGGKTFTRDQQKMTPATQFLLSQVNKSTRPSLHNLPPAQARLEYKRSNSYYRGGGPSSVGTQDFSIAGDNVAIPVRLYVPQGATGVTPLILYFHGGGFVVGDLDTHDDICRFIAHNIGVKLLAVHYRLAPENKFPAAFLDAVSVYQFCCQNADRMGINPEQLVIAGDSAGGNIAAALTHHVCQTEAIKPAFQLLIYPVMDLSEYAESYQIFGNGCGLEASAMDWFRDHYLARPLDRLDPRASPLLADSLGNLPPTYVCSAGFDPLRDEARAYAEKLKAAGVSVEYINHEGLIHGFSTGFTINPDGRKAVERYCAAVKAALNQGS